MHREDIQGKDQGEDEKEETEGYEDQKEDDIHAKGVDAAAGIIPCPSRLWVQGPSSCP